jgi:uncharacterized protein (TIGR00255 family)
MGFYLAKSSMAVYSMTGFGNASQRAQSATPEGSAEAGRGSAETGAVTVDIRSVNGRFLDLSLRLPDEARHLEPALRELVNQQFKRGKIELRLSLETGASRSTGAPQAEQLMQLARIQSQVQDWLPQAGPLSVGEILAWCRGGSSSRLDDDTLLACARQALVQLGEARAREGERLAAILMERVQRLRELAVQAGPLVPQVVAKQQQRFLERWQAAIEAAGSASSLSPEQIAERALNEAAAYAIRIDVAEELGRLAAHLDEITRLLAKGGEVGKRLDFLIQELHREANTLGSKSAALELTQISVDMKVAIEQMREQVQNLE